MIEKIRAEKIFDYSGAIRTALIKAAPPFFGMDDFKAAKVLMGICKGDMEAWIVRQEGRLAGYAITKIVDDPYLETKELLVYCAYAMEKLSLDTWDSCFRMMAGYAKKKGCTAMTAYSMVGKIKDMALRMGGAEMSYLYIPLGEENV